MVIYSASTSQSQRDFNFFFFRVYCLGPQIERSLSCAAHVLCCFAICVFLFGRLALYDSSVSIVVLL